MIVVNGRDTDLSPGITLRGVLDSVGAPGRGVAVAVDAEVVPRGEWDVFRVPDGARVEILTAVQGG
ncbi:sulfur carrier protein ThiS [Baekduia soli]|uniref:sulfur carrier protein ThiS n=1 Tax=Baekduia soli TaxID=496014 RepID=UPI0016522112|nr:sulfur carrier protein ThiS [Baekduia soli]